MRNGSTTAFTLTEVIVVVAIIGVVAAITFPIVTSMKKSAKVTKTLQNLKSLHAGAMLYQADYQGASVGTIEEMGLPSFIGTTEPFPHTNEYFYPWYADVKSPFGEPPTNNYNTFLFPSKLDALRPTWSQCTRLRGDACILYYDFFEPGKDSYTNRWISNVEHLRKRVNGIALAGNIVTREDRGATQSQAWWIPNFYEKQP